VSANLQSCWLLLNTNKNRNKRGVRAIQIDFSDATLILKAAANAIRIKDTKILIKRDVKKQKLFAFPANGY